MNTQSNMLPSTTGRHLTRLNRSLEELLADLQKYSHEQLNRPPRPGAWSPLQIVHHLMLSERLSLAYVRKKAQAPAESLPRITWSEPLRRAFVQFYLVSPLKMKAPAVVAGDKLPRESNLEETAAQWRRQRAELGEVLTQLPAEVHRRAVYRHPFAGRFGLPGMVAFFQHHFDHHRRKLNRY